MKEVKRNLKDQTSRYLTIKVDLIREIIRCSNSGIEYKDKFYCAEIDTPDTTTSFCKPTLAGLFRAIKKELII